MDGRGTTGPIPWGSGRDRPWVQAWATMRWVLVSHWLSLISVAMLREAG